MRHEPVQPLTYEWTAAGSTYSLTLVSVEGTNGAPYSFGDRPNLRAIDLPGFFIATLPVTQALWAHVMGADANPSVHKGMDLPLENVSWDEVTRPGGFLDCINRSPIHAAFSARQDNPRAVFRLPSETEWEYAARGGPHWRDQLPFSGSSNIDEVAWYHRRHGDHTQPVALKEPNQFGIYEMSGNVWEWCQDVHTPDVADIPSNGSPYRGPGTERVLRGGCFHNWAVHCTVSKRYEISHGYSDGCIGFRLVFG